MIEGVLVSKVGDRVVVGIHFLACIPGFASGTVAITLDPAVAEMIFAPPPLEAVPVRGHAPGLSLKHK